MNNIVEKINEILYEWDPLNLEDEIARDEYRGFIPLILKHINNKEDLTLCLENILIDNLETGYDKNNDEHRKNLNEIVINIMLLID